MNIKEWAIEDRPREKLYAHGSKNLTNAELLAIVLSSGTRKRSALALAKDVLKKSENDLQGLATMDFTTLCSVNGIGRAKAITIKAVMELANRRNERTEIRRKITCSQDSFAELGIHFRDLQVEEFWILYLNRANRVVGKERVSIGGVAGTVVDPKVVFRPAIEHLATGIILSHNHPSGNLRPSSQDKTLTERLKQAGKNLDVTVFDHLVISGGQYFSFADEGLL